MKMQLNLKMLLLGIAITITAFSITSCKKENAPADTGVVLQADNEIAVLKDFLSNATGVELEKIIYNESTKQFFLDGDMMMPLNFARGHYEKFKAQPGGRPVQRRFNFVMNNTAASSVAIFVRADMPAAWVTAIDQAIGNWNSNDCLIRVSRTANPAGATITMVPYFDNTVSTIAFASFPDAVGNAGPTIDVNTFYNTLSASQKQFAMTHEMGHCFGFTHTNQSFGSIIDGTPVTDPNSVMNATVLNWNGFTPYDYIAYGVVYPNAPGTKRLLRYYSGGQTNHFYTANPAELGQGAGGYIFERSEGYIYTSQVAGTVPFYRYYSSGASNHFYTTNFAELGGGGSGYVYEGVAGYIFPSQVAGSRPLYRFYNPGARDHFYTLVFGSYGGYIYEGVAGYVR
jgi:Dual-action HEIGH metallo-peptidase/Repeat of unknown function (DUF5648)